MSQNERKMYRLETIIPATMTPMHGGVPQDKIETEILDISGMGCKVKYPKGMTECEQFVIDFNLGKEPMSIYCEALRYNKEHGVIALSFSYPYNAPANGGDPFEWLRRKISAFEIQNERYAKAANEAQKKTSATA